MFSEGMNENTIQRLTNNRAYPDATGDVYVCQQAHTSLSGWEPPAVPALWAVKGT